MATKSIWDTLEPIDVEEEDYKKSLWDELEPIDLPEEIGRKLIHTPPLPSPPATPESAPQAPPRPRMPLFRPEAEPVAQKLGLSPTENEFGLAEADTDETFVKRYTDLLWQGAKSVPAAMLGGLEQIAHIVGKGEVLETPGVGGSLAEIGPELEEALHEGAEWEGFKPPEGWQPPQNIFEGAVFNLPQMAGQVGSWIVAGPAAAGMYMFSQIAGQQYHDLVNQGVDKDLATAMSLANAGVQMPLEHIGLGKLLKPWMPTQGIAKVLSQWGKRAGTEGLTEWLQKFPEEITYHIATHPGDESSKMLMDIIKQVPEWAWEGARWDAPIGALLGGFFSAPGAMYAVKNEVNQKRKDQVITGLIDQIEEEIKNNPQLALSHPEAFMKLEKDLALPPGQGFVLAAQYSNWSPELAQKLIDEKEKLPPPPDRKLLPPGEERKQLPRGEKEPVDFSVYSPEVAEFLRWVHKPGNFPIEEQRTDPSKRQLLPEPELGPEFVMEEAEGPEAAARAVEAALEMGSREAIEQATREYEKAQGRFDRTGAVVRNILREKPGATIGEIYREARSRGADINRQDLAKMVNSIREPSKAKATATQKLVGKDPKGIRSELEGTIEKDGFNEMQDKYNPAKVGGVLFQDLKTQGLTNGEARAQVEEQIAQYTEQYNSVVQDELTRRETEKLKKEEAEKEAKKVTKEEGATEVPTEKKEVTEKKEKEQKGKEKPKKETKGKKKGVKTQYRGQIFPTGTRVLLDGDPGVVIEPPEDASEIYTKNARYVRLDDDGEAYPAGLDELELEGVEDLPPPRTEEEIEESKRRVIDEVTKELAEEKTEETITEEKKREPEVVTKKKGERKPKKKEKPKVKPEDRDMIRSNIMELRNHPFREQGLNSPQRIWKDFHKRLHKYLKAWAPEHTYLADHFESFMYQDKRDMAINVAEEGMSTLHDAAGKMGLEIEAAEMAEKIALEPVLDEGFVPYENSIPEDDRMYLVRYHPVAGKATLDPTEEEYTNIKGEEKKTRVGSEAPHMYHYYMEGGAEELQVKALPIKYRSLVPKSKLYDVIKDPLDLKSKAKPKGMVTIDINLAEKMMKEAGYWGYHIPKSRWPSTVRIFQKLPSHEIAKREPITVKSYKDGVEGYEDVKRNILISDKKEITKGSGKGRTLLVQISSKTMSDSVSDEYFDKLYSQREGYYRPEDFWEVPVWIGEAAHVFPNSDAYVVRGVSEAVDLMNFTEYDTVMFSAMDTNKEIIKDIAERYGGKVVVGGYIDPTFFKGLKNVKFYDSMDKAAKGEGVKYSRGINYHHFKGTKTVPRLCLSTGCLHKCAFCVVKKKVMAQPTKFIDQQLEAIKDLDFELVYLDDKTFGQASNYKYLSEVNKRIKKFNPKFKGFVIQTTAPQFMKLDDGFIQESGIRYVELGVESYNDEILKRVKKPHNTKLLDRAVNKIRKNNLQFIPNILVGLAGKDANGKIWSETQQSYARTMSFLRINRNIISHINVYNLALYEGTELAAQLEVKSEIDLDENQVTRSYHLDPEIHEQFYHNVMEFASERLDLGKKQVRTKQVGRKVDTKTDSKYYDILRQTFPEAEIGSYSFASDSYFLTLPNGARIEVVMGSLPEDTKVENFKIHHNLEGMKQPEVVGLWKVSTDASITGEGVIYLAHPSKFYANHESFHAAVSMVLTVPEIKYLRERFKGGKHPNPEENAADAYAEFSEKISANPIFRKIQLWARRLMQALGFSDHPKVFYDIASGKVWKRPLGKPSGKGRVYDAIAGMERHLPKYKKGTVRYYDKEAGKWIEEDIKKATEKAKRKALDDDFERISITGAIRFAEGVKGANWTSLMAQEIREAYGLKAIPKGLLKRVRKKSQEIFKLRTEETLEGRLPTMEEILSIEERGAKEGGLVWYDVRDGLSALTTDDSGEVVAKSAKTELEEYFGEDAEDMALLIAHLSSSMNVVDNVKKAIDVYVRLKTGQPITGTHAVQDWSIYSAIESGITTGDKRVPFLEAILGNADAVVIDRWMGRVFNFAKYDPKTKKLTPIDNPTTNQRKMIRQWIEMGAKRYGVSNRAYQALLWAGKKALDEEAKGRPTGTLDPLYKVINDHVKKASIPVKEIPKGEADRYAILPGDPSRAVGSPLQAIDQQTLFASVADQRTPEMTIDDVFGEMPTNFRKKVKGTLAKARKWRKYLVDKYDPIKERLGENAYKMFRMLAGSDALFQAVMEKGKITIDDNGRVGIDRATGGAGEFFKKHGDDARNMLYWAALKRAERLGKSYKYKKVREYSRNSVDLAQRYIDNHPDEHLKMRVTDNKIIIERGRPREQWLVGERRAAVEKHLRETGKPDEFYQGLYDEFVKFHTGILDLAEAMGLISKKQRDTWLSDIYVPFHRIFQTAEGDEDSKHPYSTDVIGSKLKDLYGAKMKLGDPIENVVANWSYLIKESLRNAATANAFDAARSIQAEQGGDPIVTDADKAGFDTISYMDKGNRKFVRLHDFELFQTIRNVNQNAVPRWMRSIFGRPKRWLTYGITRSPAFVLANSTRDTLASWVLTKNFIPVIDSIRGAFHIMTNSDEYVNAMAAGALFGGSYMRAEDPQSLQKMARRMVPKKGKGVVLDTLKSAWEFYEKFIDASENAARMGIFLKNIRSGLSDFDAAYEARDITDFSNHGASVPLQYLLATVPFLGARAQGNYKFYRGLKENPLGFAAKGSLLALASLGLWALYADDDRYKELEDWDKWTYYHFWAGDKHYKIPKPFEVGVVFSSAVETAANLITNKEEKEFLKRFIFHSMNQTFAIDMPQLIKPAVEQWANKSFFTGRPIESYRLQGLKRSERYYSNTSELMRVLGKQLNLSPTRMEELVNGYFGTLGAGLLTMADQGTRWFADFPERPRPRTDDYPLVGRFWKEGPAKNNKYATRFYDMVEESEKLVKTVKHYMELGDMAEARRLMKEDVTAYAYNKHLTSIRRQLSDIRKVMRQIENSRKYTSDEKREKLDRYYRLRNKLVKNAYDIYTRARKG